MYALNKYNKTTSGRSKFTLLDASILCLAKSFYESKSKLFMSNVALAELFLVDPATIQRSIDRLVKTGLILKETEYSGHKKRRSLTYNPDEIKKIS